MKIIEQLKEAKSVAIGGHVRPDGDCIGSAMALYLYLSKEMSDAKVDVYLEEPAETFHCIKGISDIKTTVNAEDVYDVFIVLDSTAERLGEFEILYKNAKKTINIDHHVSNLGTSNVNYINVKASSTSELIYEVIEEDKLDEHIAKAIYMGIVHDTGVFRYSNTSPQTLSVAAKLIAYGFDFSKLIDETFYEKTYVQNQILGRTILESILLIDGKCIVSVVTRRIMEFYGVVPKDLDGIVNQMQITKGVECALLLYETDTLEFKVSMRSKADVNVAEVAAYFGGGGHIRAAGCTMKGTFHDVVNNLTLHIEKQLQEKNID